MQKVKLIILILFVSIFFLPYINHATQNEFYLSDSISNTPTANPTALQYVNSDDVIAYPIPASSIVNFAYKFPDTSGVVEIKIYNTGFRVVKVITDDSGENRGQLRWNVSDIAPGIYFYRFKIGDKQLPMKRLVIAR